MIKVLIDNKILMKGREQIKKFDSITQRFITTGVKFVLHDLIDTDIILYFTYVNLLNKVRFAPKVLTYDPEAQDPVLRSKRKVEQINILNSTKVFLSPTYVN